MLDVAELDEPGPAAPEADRVAAREGGFAAVPAERHPRTAAAKDTMARYVTTEQFRWGLDRILDGLART